MLQGAASRVQLGAELLPLLGCVQGVDLFDAGYFRMSRAEATALDPQTRVLLAVSQEALLDAGEALSPGCALLRAPLARLAGFTQARHTCRRRRRLPPPAGPDNRHLCGLHVQRLHEPAEASQGGEHAGVHPGVAMLIAPHTPAGCHTSCSTPAR